MLFFVPLYEWLSKGGVIYDKKRDVDGERKGVLETLPIQVLSSI